MLYVPQYMLSDPRRDDREVVEYPVEGKVSSIARPDVA